MPALWFVFLIFGLQVIVFLSQIPPGALGIDHRTPMLLKVSQSSSIPLILRGSRGVLELIPAVIGRAAGYTLDRMPVCCRADI